MNDPFLPINWAFPPGTWPSWLPATLLGGSPTSWRAQMPTDIWNQSAPVNTSSNQATGRGILGQFERPPESTTPSLLAPLSPPASAATSSPYRGWYRNSPSWVHSAMPLGAKVGFSAAPAEPAYQPWIDPRDDRNGWERPPQVPPSPAPVLPLPGPHGWYYPGAQLDPTPPAPVKDFRTRLREAISDENVRYYAGPGFYEALQKLAALAQFLPGSGTVQAGQDASQAGEDARSGNYGGAAAHLGMGAANAALDWLPAGKVFTALLGGMGARTFPWGSLGLAERMEKAGQSVDEIWRATGLGRGADGLWRFEIPETGYRVKPNAGILDSEGYRAAPLYEQQAHPGMQAAYPGLAEAKSRLRIDPSAPPSGLGVFTPGRVDVEARIRPMLKSLSIHELQHMIGHLEGFARGGSPWEFLRPGVLYPEAHALYERLAGEVEARNVARERLYRNEAQRRRKAPLTTEDTPRDQQIIRFIGRSNGS